MNWKKILVAFLYADFLALTAYAAVMEGPTGIVEAVGASWWSLQVFLDLCVAATFATVWMWRDAKKHGINPLPYALAVPLTGSIALFAYALRRPWEASPTRVARAAA